MLNPRKHRVKSHQGSACTKCMHQSACKRKMLMYLRRCKRRNGLHAHRSTRESVQKAPKPQIAHTRHVKLRTHRSIPSTATRVEDPFVKELFVTIGVPPLLQRRSIASRCCCSFGNIGSEAVDGISVMVFDVKQSHRKQTIIAVSEVLVLLTLRVACDRFVPPSELPANKWTGGLTFGCSGDFRGLPFP